MSLASGPAWAQTTVAQTAPAQTTVAQTDPALPHKPAHIVSHSPPHAPVPPTLRRPAPGAAGGAAGSAAQNAAGSVAGGAPAPSPEAVEGLLSLAGRAAVVFAGEVVLITRADERGFVDIAFRIQHAVRGCPVAGTYVLREWAGLWSGGAVRYRVGQRLLLLLAARGPSGISGPVGGTDGAIPLLPDGASPIVAAGVPPPDAGVLPTPAAAADILRAGVDLRWVETHAVRAAGQTAAAATRTHPAAAAAAPDDPGEERTGETGWAGPARPIHRPVSTGGGAAPALPTLADVLALLGPSVPEAHRASR